MCRKKNPDPAGHCLNDRDRDGRCHDDRAVDVGADSVVLLSEISYVGVKQTVGEDVSWPCKMVGSCGDVYLRWFEDECVPERT